MLRFLLTIWCRAVCLQVPMVIRGPGGVGRQLGAEHSQRLESYFQSIPGVQLVACSTVANSKALLKAVSGERQTAGSRQGEQGRQRGRVPQEEPQTGG